MASVRFKLPVLGVADAPAFTAQDGATCPPDALRDVWPRERGAKHYNLTTRDPLSLIAAAGVPGKPVQCMGVVGTASDVTGYDQTDPTVLTSGVSRVSGNWIGQGLVLDPGETWTVNRVLCDARGTGATMNPPPASVGGYGGFGCCWHATDPDVGYLACIGQDTAQTTDPNTIVFVARFALTTPDAWTHTAYAVDADAPYTAPISGAQVPLTVSQMFQLGPYLFVVANRYIYTFRADNLTYLKRTPLFMAIEGQSIVPMTISGKDYLWAANTGSAAITGPIVADAGTPAEAFGEHARSALALHQIQYADATLKTPVAIGANPIRRWAIPQGTQAGDAAYEAHETFRPSEYGKQRPKGGLIYSAAPHPSGDVFIARCNQGFDYAGNGPDVSPINDVTVARCVLAAAYDAAPAEYISPTTGTRYGLRRDLGGWEADIEGYRQAFVQGGTTYQCDIPRIIAGVRDPGGVSNAPSAFALAYLSSLDVLCVGGYRPSSSSANVHGVRGLDGAIRWRRSLGGCVLQNAIAANPARSSFIVGVKRNADWAGSGGAWAELFELDAATGRILNSFDLTNEVMNNGVFDFSSSPAPLSLNAGAYAVAVNSRGQVLVALAPFRQSA